MVSLLLKASRHRIPSYPSVPPLRAIGQGFDVTSLAIKEASQSRRDSTDTAFRALDLAEARSGSEGLDLLKSSGKFLTISIGIVALVFFIGRKL